MSTATTDDEVAASISLEPIETATYAVPILGLTPVIPHKWSEKSLRLMREKQSGSKIQPKRGAKVPEDEAEAATYRLADGRPGMPATAFKAALVDSVRFFQGITMVQAKMSLFVEGDGVDQLIAIEGEDSIREDTPRNATGVVDLRYRRQFWPWSAVLPITFLPTNIDVSSVLSLVDAAGLAGVGDWRPSAPKSKTGTFGRFTVNRDLDIKPVYR